VFGAASYVITALDENTAVGTTLSTDSSISVTDADFNEDLIITLEGSHTNSDIYKFATFDSILYLNREYLHA